MRYLDSKLAFYCLYGLIAFICLTTLLCLHKSEQVGQLATSDIGTYTTYKQKFISHERGSHMQIHKYQVVMHDSNFWTGLKNLFFIAN